MTLKKISLFIVILCANLLFSQRTKEDLQKQSAELKRQIATINSELAKKFLSGKKFILTHKKKKDSSKMISIFVS